MKLTSHLSDQKAAVNAPQSRRFASIKYHRDSRSVWTAVSSAPLLARTRERGITLIECIVYISLVMIVLGLATAAFYRCFDNMKALRRNADDITTTLHAGELWRADIRAAAKPVTFDEATQVLRIPRTDREVAYKFSGTQILRRANADAPWITILTRVGKSQMQTDVRPQVTAWRWELELQSLRQPATIRPLFTFTAVPGANQP